MDILNKVLCKWRWSSLFINGFYDRNAWIPLYTL